MYTQLVFCLLVFSEANSDLHFKLLIADVGSTAIPPNAQPSQHLMHCPTPFRPAAPQQGAQPRAVLKGSSPPPSAQLCCKVPLPGITPTPRGGSATRSLLSEGFASALLQVNERSFVFSLKQFLSY